MTKFKTKCNFRLLGRSFEIKGRELRIIGKLFIVFCKLLFVASAERSRKCQLSIANCSLSKSNVPIRKMLLCLLLIANCPSLIAQQTISLQAAIDTALRNNLSVKNDQLKAEYQKLLIGTAKNIAPANVIAEAGQVNSVYFDTKLSVSQTFSLPVVYKRQKELLEQEAKSSFLNIAVKESSLKLQVEQGFYQLLYLQQKLQLLQSADTLYTSFLNRAALRLSKGESNVLEKATAENQLGQIKIQMEQIKSDRKLAQLQFQLLLNSTTNFTPVASGYKLRFETAADTNIVRQHPVLTQVLQQQQVANALIKTEQSKLLPDFILGINNTSIKGTGADNKLYSAAYRFTSAQVGLAIPIFAKAQKARLAAAKYNSKVAESAYSVELQAMQSAYASALVNYQKHLQSVNYHEKNTLATAALITKTADQQFINGSINYLEWVMLVNQSITTQNEYVEAVKNLNEAVIQLHYFSNK